MAKRLVLAAQLPEPPEMLELVLPSGKMILATPLAALSSEQQSQMLANYRRLVTAQHQLRNARTEVERTRIGTQLLDIISKLTRVFVPSITDVDLVKLSPDQHVEIIQWWIGEHPELKSQATASQANQPLSMTQPSQKTALPNSRPVSSKPTSRATQRRFGRHRNG